MDKAVSILLLVVGVINFVPVVGVLSAAKLSQAYGIELDSNDLVILLRHRAMLFGIVGGFILYSVMVPSYQVAAMVMAALAMLGYVFLMWQVGGYNAALHKIMLVDFVGIICLAAAVLLKLWARIAT